MKHCNLIHISFLCVLGVSTTSPCHDPCRAGFCCGGVPHVSPFAFDARLPPHFSFFCPHKKTAARIIVHTIRPETHASVTIITPLLVGLWLAQHLYAAEPGFIQTFLRNGDHRTRKTGLAPCRRRCRRCHDEGAACPARHAHWRTQGATPAP